MTSQETKETAFLRAKFEARADDGVFEGYGAVFGNVDQGGDIVVPGAFQASLAEHRERGSMPAMLWMHRPDAPIGKWLAVVEDGVGLHVRGKLNLGTTAGREAFAHIMDGDVTGLSIGYSIPPGGAERAAGGVQRIRTANVEEVSVVTLPMNREARIRLGSKGDLESLLTKSGLAREAARRIAFGGWPALTRNDPDDLAAMVRAVKASAARYKG